MQDDLFDAPPEGAIQQGFERFKFITYKAAKTPTNFSGFADEATLKSKGALGFEYWDADNRQKVPVPDLTFVALAFYAGVSGYDGNGTSYRSNRVADTRKDHMVLFDNHSKTPILSGLYAGKSASADKIARIGGQPLPTGASYTLYCKAWCVQMSEVVEIELTAGVQAGMKIAVADAEERARRRTDPEKIFLLGLASGDYLWGFHLVGYEKTDKDWKPYANAGDLFFRPVFHAGILNAQKQAELHATCGSEQNAEHARHEAYRAKYAAQPEPQPQQPATVGDTTPTNTTVTASQAVDAPFPPAATVQVPVSVAPRVEPPQESDLPF